MYYWIYFRKGKRAYYVGISDVITLIYIFQFVYSIFLLQQIGRNSRFFREPTAAELAPGRCLLRAVLARLRAWRAPRRADSAGRAPASPWRRHLVQELLLVLVEREQLEVEVQLPAGERGVEPAARGGGPGWVEDGTEPREVERRSEEEVGGLDCLRHRRSPRGGAAWRHPWAMHARPPPVWRTARTPAPLWGRGVAAQLPALSYLEMSTWSRKDCIHIKYGPIWHSSQ